VTIWQSLEICLARAIPHPKCFSLAPHSLSSPRSILV
jgi:hypothetical protein